MNALLAREPVASRQLISAPLRVGPLLVPTDGNADSNIAMGAAKLLVGHAGTDVQLVAAREPLPRYGRIAPDFELEEALDERLREAIRVQVSRSMARDEGWPIHILHGSPADVIARHAGEEDARMIIVGRGPRDRRHSVLGGKLAMRLAQITDVPILSAASPSHAVPRRALIGLDFSPRSIEAAREAIALFDDVPLIHLAHVVPRIDTTLPGAEAWQSAYMEGLGEAFERARDSLHVRPATTVETLVLHGDPGRELLAAAGYLDVDLLISGTHGRGFVQRRLLGGVATKLLRAATCSVLLVPNAPRALTM